MTEAEKVALGQLVLKGKAAARKRTHAQVVLKADAGEHGPAWTDEQIRELLDVHYPDAKRITLVMDNLNTHHVASLYEAFDPAEARRLIERLEGVYTPKHGSWLNIAEIELNALSRQCLSRRIDKKEFLRSEVAAWEADRNRTQTGVDWRFTTDDARIKLKRLYPQMQS